MTSRQYNAVRVKERLTTSDEVDGETRAALRSLQAHYREQHAAKRKREDLLNRFHHYCAKKAAPSA